MAGDEVSKRNSLSSGSFQNISPGSKNVPAVFRSASGVWMMAAFLLWVWGYF